MTEVASHCFLFQQPGKDWTAGGERRKSKALRVRVILNRSSLEKEPLRDIECMTMKRVVVVRRTTGLPSLAKTKKKKGMDSHKG